MDANVMGAATIVGIVLPLLVSYLKNIEWSREVKQLVAGGLSLVAAAFVGVVDNGITNWNVDQLVTNFALIFTAAQITYTQYFGKTELNKKLENTGVTPKGN